jgi:hypothetical protein
MICNWIKPCFQKADVESGEEILEPLLPVADPETYQRYAGAFHTIIKTDVMCVAVTGPYGAGKTSLINAFQKTYSNLKFTRISLATFEGDDEKWITSDKIEKSILQQLIYSASAGKLEYSRFKKIRKPTLLKTKALLLSVFAISTAAALYYWPLVERHLAQITRWQDLVIAGPIGLIWMLLFIAIVYGIIKTSAGLSIKKLSLKDAEIETEEKSTDSVFNKHLDEIIYFFQETPCDIVIIEDLDRFGKTEIFTKIREINQLINSNPDVRLPKKKPIVFVFAIRDDLFRGKDRTKFFDLLIPVIPFVSAGNAYDVLHNKLVKAGLREALNNKFLRQVTVYVTDNRHLVNIVNEYSIYRRNLFDTNHDPNKLFGVILYKVFFPSDFGKLHMNEGVLAGLVSELQERRRNMRGEILRKLEEINHTERQIREGQIRSRTALAYAYIGAIRHRYRDAMGFQSSRIGTTVGFNDNIDAILNFLQETPEISVINAHGGRTAQLEVAGIAEIIHAGLSITQRLSEIDRSAEQEEKGLALTRAALDKELRDARYLPMRKAFSAAEIKSMVSEFEHGELFVFLIINGYLGEDYDEYTSYFHKGATTRIDREFVQRFNKGDKIEFSERVDTPSEILLILDDGMFGKPQGFNISIVDHVLDQSPSNRARLVGGFKAFPDDALRFLEAYYSEGKFTARMIPMLISAWDGFLDVAAKCETPIPHVKAILEYASDQTISRLRKPAGLADVIELFAPELFDRSELVSRIPLLAKSGIRFGDIRFRNLLDEERPNAIKHVSDHDLWAITPNNVATILDWIGVDDQASGSGLFLSLERAPSTVSKYIKDNINVFVEDCFLQMKSTVSEPQDSIEKLLSVESLKEDLGKSIVTRQTARLRFVNVPSAYWETIIAEQKYVVDWENIEELFVETGGFEDLEPIFESDLVVAELATARKAISQDLFNFLVGFDGMSIESYRALIGPDLGAIFELPVAIDSEFKLHLIRSGMIELNEESFNWLQGEPALRVALIEKRLATFRKNIEAWTLGEGEVSGLLMSTIPDELKISVLLRFGSLDCRGDAALAKEIARILSSFEGRISEFDESFIEAIIEKSPERYAVKLLALMIPRWDEIRVMRSLVAIGTPYEEIADYGKRPTIARNQQNIGLAEALAERGFISQFREEKNGIRIITKRKDPSE